MKGNAAQLAQPRRDVRLYLLHGPDEAGATHLARRLVGAMSKDVERVTIDVATLRKEPARLADEAASLSLFGAARVIQIAPVGEEAAAAFTLLLAMPRAEHPVIAIAPSVKTSGRIVKLAIAAPGALAVACYQPTGAEADRLAATLLGEHGLRPAAGLAHRLAAASGGDRAILAQEVEKLALYLDATPDRPRDAGHAALDAIGADGSEAEATRALDALIDGRVADLGGELVRLGETGTSAIPWLRLLQRRLIGLAEMRAAIDGGEAVDAVMKQYRIFFRDEARTAHSLRRWSPAMLAAALARIRIAERAVMAPANAGTVLADAAALSLARRVERRG